MRAFGWAPPKALDGSDSEWSSKRLRALAYVVGVIFKGNGSVYKSLKSTRNPSHKEVSYEVALRATSRQSVDFFIEECGCVLRRKLVRAQGPYKDGCYVGKYRSVDFYKWWKELSFESIRAIAYAIPVQYLQGRFDSESGVGDYAVYMFGAISHFKVLELDRELCIKVGLRTGPLLPYGHVGEIGRINGRTFVSKEQKLRFSVNAKDFLKILHRIKVEERNAKLLSMIRGRAWTPWSESIREVAIALGNTGLNHNSISERLAMTRGMIVPRMTIYSWQHGTSSWDAYVQKAKSEPANS